MTIKHVSFDVWNTLITPNPEYAEARTEYLSKVLSMSLDDTKTLYTKTKKWIDELAFVEGTAPSTPGSINMLLYKAEVHADCYKIQRDLEKLFKSHPPIIATETREMIEELSYEDLLITIGSNSNFISGILMHQFLNYQFGNIFSGGMYSDVCGYAKPVNLFFEGILDLQEIYTGERNRQNILHVGDHKEYDVRGAEEAGMQSYHLKSVTDIAQILEVIR